MATDIFGKWINPDVSGYAGQGGKFGVGTYSGIGGAVNDLFSSQATASGLRLKAQGDLVEAGNYDLAAALAKQNEQFTEQSTAVKQAMADRQIYMGIGTERADIAGSGFAESGTSLDLLRSSAQQGAMQKQLLGQQGLITEAGYNEQRTAYTNLADFARSTAATEESMASQAITAGYVSAAFKVAGVVASLA